MRQKYMVRFVCILSFIFAVRTYSSPLDSLSRESEGRINLSGPRFGVSIVKGHNADRMKKTFDVNPIVSQFGWQFETKFLSTHDGFAGLSEWIPLVAGVEQGVFLPSLSWLVGFRTGQGTEIGFGPNVSLGGVGLVIAGGITARTETLNFPFNFAVSLYKESATFTMLIGFNSAE
jgi:hypothetical protein